MIHSGCLDLESVVGTEVEWTAYSGCICGMLALSSSINCQDLNRCLPIGSCGPAPLSDSLADAVSQVSQVVGPTDVLKVEMRRNVYLTIECVPVSVPFLCHDIELTTERVL